MLKSMMKHSKKIYGDGQVVLIHLSGTSEHLAYKNDAVFHSVIILKLSEYDFSYFRIFRIWLGNSTCSAARDKVTIC